MRRPSALRPLTAVLAVAVGLITVGLVACGPSDSPPDASGGPPPTAADGLTASVKQGRLDIAARRLVVHLENGGAEPISVDHLELGSPTLIEPIVRTKPVELGAGDAIDLRLDLGAAQCDAGADPSATPTDQPTATLQLTLASTDAGSDAGGERVVELTPSDPFDTFARIHDEECFAARVAEVAELRLVEPLRVEGSGAEQRAVIEVTVDPQAAADADGNGGEQDGGELVFRRALSSTLLSAEDGGGDWTLEGSVAPGDAPFVIELPVRPARCDAHAIADDKRGTIMRLEIADGDTIGLVELVAPPALKAELYAYYGERCGLE